MKSSRSLLRFVLLSGIGSFAVVPSFPLHAQAQAHPAKSATDYGGESSLFESYDRVYTYAADGTGSRQITGVIRVQTEAGIKNLSVLEFGFASSSEHVEIDYVRVRRADGTVLATPATDAQEQPAPVTREAPFYSDLKQEQVPVRSLRVGDRLEYSVRFIRTRAEAPGHFWGDETFITPSTGAVALSESVEVRVPADAYIHVWSPHFEPTTTTDAGQRIYRWHSAQPIPVAGKDKSALLKLDKYPDLSGDDASLPDIAWTNFHTWQEVGAWYRSLEGSRTQPDDDIRAKVTQLTAGKTTNEEKARAIYDFVGLQVRYIGVAFGIGRYQPHQAADVLSNQYGDCKDKTTLLASMLSAAGIPADAVLIGPGIAFNETVPSPAAFNHAITLAHVDNQPVWLDSTAEVAPYRLLQATIRGKRALVIPLTGDAHLDTTPRDPPFAVEDHFDAIGTLDDKGTSHSKITMTVRGDDELIFRQAVRSVSPAQWDELMQRISYAMSYAGKVTNAEFSRPEDTAAPFHITYDYEREKAGDWDNLRIIPQLPPIGLGDADEKDPPVTPILLGSPGVQVSHAVMTLPAGWSAELPEPVHVKTTFATFDKTYKLDHGALVTDRRFVILQQKIPAADWKAYHQWYKDTGLAGETYVQLTRINTGGITVNSNEDAARLVSEANQLERDKSFDEAAKRLDQAKALNEHQAYLWSNYAFLALQYGKPHEATEDLHREIANHPDEAIPYRMLAAAQMAQHDNPGAIATLKQFLATNPGDEMATSMAASLLISQKDLAGAEALLRQQIKVNADSTHFKLMLASTLARDGKLSEAQSMLEEVANTSNDPNDLNNAAYTLADNNLDLPLAEQAARKALSLLEESSANGETGKAALTRSELLINTWDTLGWILFHENKFIDAEAWIRASWRNGMGAEPGFHLGMTLERNGLTSDALSAYQSALDGVKGDNAGKVQFNIQSRITALRSAGTHTNPTHSLQDQRTYHVPRPSSLPSFWADVEVEVTFEGTRSARYVNGTGQTAMLSAVKNLDLHLDIPGHAHLFRRGILSCHSGPTCDFVLELPHDATIE